MRPALIHQLTETIYDAAVDPSGWTNVMRQMKEIFRTGAETLYFLDYRNNVESHVHIEGISDTYLTSFEKIFYTPDNPCIRSPELHRPGVIRTDEILCRHLGAKDVLTRSCYYNEWMRPQDLAHTMGATPLAEDGRVLNLSLLRSASVGRFTAGERRSFGQISSHLQRAVQTALRLDTLTARRGLAAEALDGLRHGVVLLSEHGRVLHANSAAEALFRRNAGLGLRAGRLVAAGTETQKRLDALLGQLARAPAETADLGPVVVPRPDGTRRLIVSGTRLSGARTRFLSARATLLLLIVDPAVTRPTGARLLQRLYGFNPTEARLAQALMSGDSLRDAADAAGITYETARWYLKVLFQKTETRRQTDFVARLIGDVTAALHCVLDAW